MATVSARGKKQIETIEGRALAIGIVERDLFQADAFVQTCGKCRRLRWIGDLGLQVEEGEKIFQVEQVAVDIAHPGEQAAHEALSLVHSLVEHGYVTQIEALGQRHQSHPCQGQGNAEQPEHAGADLGDHLLAGKQQPLGA